MPGQLEDRELPPLVCCWAKQVGQVARPHSLCPQHCMQLLWPLASQATLPIAWLVREAAAGCLPAVPEDEGVDGGPSRVLLPPWEAPGLPGWAQPEADDWTDNMLGSALLG